MNPQMLELRQRISTAGLRLIFLTYGGVAAYFGVDWIHAAATPAENACNTGIKPADPGTAILVGIFLAAILLVSGCCVVRPPRRLLYLIFAIAALAGITVVGVVYGGAASLDWCNFAPG